MQQIVGLMGLRGSGKDTAAKTLVAAGWQRVAFADALYREAADAYGVELEFLQNRDTKETPLARLALEQCNDAEFIDVVLQARGVARSLRRAMRDKSFLRPGMTRRLKKELKKPLSPRFVLQWWGTEYRRMRYRDDYWREQVRQVILANPDINFIITDVRFPDEGSMLKGMGGTVSRVVRPGLAGSNDPALMHSSERAMLDYPEDMLFTNHEGSAGLAQLQADVSAAYLGGELRQAA